MRVSWRAPRRCNGIIIYWVGVHRLPLPELFKSRVKSRSREGSRLVSNIREREAANILQWRFKGEELVC
jgi:hypothetical protein